MLRVTCSCGQELKLNDDLAGKKIKCPECATVLTVKAPAAAAVSTRPMKPAAADKDDEGAVAAGPAPARKKSAPAVNGGPTTPLPKTKNPVADDEEKLPRSKKKLPDEDDEDEEQAPRKKKKKQATNSNGLLFVLLGGTAAALLLVTVAGVGAYFLFFKKSGHSSGPAAAGAGGGRDEAGSSKGPPVAVKLHVPLEAGDVRQAKGTADMVIKIDGHGKEIKMSESLTFDITTKTLAVNAQGYQTRGEFTINSMTSTSPDLFGGAPTVTTVPPGSVVLQQCNEPKSNVSGNTLTYKMKNNKKGGSPKENNAAVRGVEEVFGRDLPLNGATFDEVFGTSEKKSVGDTWAANKAAAFKSLTAEMHFLPDIVKIKPAKEDDITATVKFEGSQNEGLDFNIDGKILALQDGAGQGKIKGSLSSADYTFSHSLRFPRDYKTGPVKVGRKTDSSWSGADAKEGLSGLSSRGLSMDITYLEKGTS